MQLSLTYYSLCVTISFCKFWFESDTLIQVRYCHLLGIWYVFVVDMVFSSVFCFCFCFFFDSAHDKLYVDIRQYLAKGSISSKYRVEPESKKSNVNDILN